MLKQINKTIDIKKRKPKFENSLMKELWAEKPLILVVDGPEPNKNLLMDEVVSNKTLSHR